MTNISQDDYELTRNWLERAQEALHVARMLSQMGESNGSVANRAYYAMLCAIFAFLVPYHIDTKKTADNEDVFIALFDEKFVKANNISEDLSKRVHDAYDLCQAYDFQPFFEISNEQALEVMSSAAEFISTIEQKLSDLQ